MKDLAERVRKFREEICGELEKCQSEEISKMDKFSSEHFGDCRNKIHANLIESEITLLQMNKFFYEMRK